MTILTILVGFLCLLQGFCRHFRLSRPHQRQFRLQGGSKRLRKRVTFRKRRQTKVYSVANFLALKLPQKKRIVTQQHAVTARPLVCSVSASLHGFRQAHASLTYGLNYRVEEIANEWRDWRCPYGHVNFPRRDECQLCSLPKMRPVPKASYSCAPQ